jgi:hypothetical protein
MPLLHIGTPVDPDPCQLVSCNSSSFWSTFQPRTEHKMAFSPQVKYTDQAGAASRRRQCQLLLVDGCHVASARGPHNRYSRFSIPGSLLFHSSGCSVILMRLSGPHSTLSTSQKMW